MKLQFAYHNFEKNYRRTGKWNNSANKAKLLAVQQPG